MKPAPVLLLTALLAGGAPGDWLDVATKGGIVTAFLYYLFVHEPKQREAEHKRRMEANSALAETVAKAVADTLSKEKTP